MKDEKKVLATALLVTASIIWGSSFLVTKNVTESFSPAFLISIRTTVASAVLILLNFKKLKNIDASYIKGGFIMGFFLFSNQILQTVALSLDAMPGKAAFLCSVYCVVVPFLYWAVKHKRPDNIKILSAFICIAGIGLVSLNGASGMTVGDMLMLMCGVMCAMSITSTAVFCEGRDPSLLVLIQISVSGIFSWLTVLFTNGLPSEISAPAMAGALYLGLFASAACMSFQAYGIKHTNPTSACIIISMESVWSVLFSVFIFKEVITLKALLGFSLILSAVLLSQINFKKASDVKPAGYEE